ncbi:phosphate ABC transporter ATP-binding protein [Chitinolyticbacter albus]|uniref:phosphate ABC transporter ATP-binding protein n=1 Tax=Chitinolyticbacter albus TaxID=2961951 RepID=UPI00210DB9DA|nr:phosphate ABC transporter ATP-binding protein [Chitinolyticbacter albus]
MTHSTLLATPPLVARPYAAAQSIADSRPSSGHIEFDDISVRYGNNKVVESVCLKVPRNSVTAMIGPSGCGKSSMLYTVNRLCDLIPGCCVTGSVEFSWLDNEQMRKDAILLRRQVGMLFQRPNPFPFSIWKNLEFALKQHGIRAKADVNERIESALQEVGLWDEVKDRLSASAFSLSGGQQQRLCLARALVLQPAVLLMDEPCSALDPISTQKIEDLILRLSRTRTILLVTHSLGQARRVASQVAMFWKLDGVGRLIECGSALDLFDQPRHDLTKSYLAYA